MKKNKWAILLSAIFYAVSISAQTKIVDNTTIGPDNTSALLELQSTNKGFLPTRVSLVATNNTLPLTESPLPAGMIVYNLATAGTVPYNITPGLYYYNGSFWVRFADAAWNLLGNAGTTDGTNFLGTTDNVPLNFRVNNFKAGRIESTTYSANTSFGYQALYSNTTGTANNAFGWVALSGNTSGNDNVAIGNGALQGNTTGSNNVAVGQWALNECCTTGNDDNTAVGEGALDHTTGIGNTAVGGSALINNYTGTYNTAIGANINSTFTNINYSTAIGAGATITNSNTMVLGGTAAPYLVKVGIGTNTPGNTLQVVGSASATTAGIGTTTPNSTLQVVGSVSAAIRTVTGATSLSNSDFTVLAGGTSGYTITLPAANTCTGRIYKILKISTGSYSLTIASAGGSIYIIATNPFTIQYTGYTFQSDGTNWYVLK